VLAVHLFEGFLFWFRPLQFFEFGETPLQFTYSEICYYNFISPSSMSFSTSAMYKGPLSGHVYVKQHIATSSPPFPHETEPACERLATLVRHRSISGRHGQAPTWERCASSPSTWRACDRRAPGRRRAGAPRGRATAARRQPCGAAR
jgi:hypothetical protein